MRAFDELVTVHADPTRPRVLVHSFTGFLDAGAAVRTATTHLLGVGERRLIASFDSDELLDFRARRPTMTFVSDHFAAVDIPVVTLHEVLDAEGTPFLLLSGPEPDYQWGSFAAAVEEFVHRFAIAEVVGLAAIPWPAPHTRPLGVTLHGNDPARLAGRLPLVGTIEVPGHMSGLIELTLGEHGHTVIGIAAHVPHYLAQFDYPRAAVTLLQELSVATGLALPTDALGPAAERAQTEVDAQVESNPEIATVVRALEQQYDAMGLGSPVSSDLAPDGEVPSGDQIAAAVERFLAEMGERDGGEDS